MSVAAGLLPALMAAPWHDSSSSIVCGGLWIGSSSMGRLRLLVGLMRQNF
jgi:hypothetical protein